MRARESGGEAALLVLSVAISAGMLAACARTGPPGGGPVDSTPPTVEATVPENGETAVDVGTEIRIAFSEEMKRATAERSFSMSPPVGLRNFTWEGRSLIARPERELPDSTTFVVEIGEGAQDYHGVAMEVPVSFRFSTGETLDTGSISGVVVRSGEPLEGATVLACVGAGPASEGTLPNGCRYRTLTGGGGTFALNAVAASKRPYRLFAFIDADGDGLWQTETETGAAADTTAALYESGAAITGIIIDLTAEED
jgi:hypothetical protein